MLLPQFLMIMASTGDAGPTFNRHWIGCQLVLAASSKHCQTSMQMSMISVDKPHCVLPIGVVPKRDNKLRLIQNLRLVHDNCCNVKFQCEDFKTVAQLIEPKDDLVNRSGCSRKIATMVIAENRDLPGLKSVVYEGSPIIVH